jgi:hypothetical protein
MLEKHLEDAPDGAAVIGYQNLFNVQEKRSYFGRVFAARKSVQKLCWASVREGIRRLCLRKLLNE